MVSEWKALSLHDHGDLEGPTIGVAVDAASTSTVGGMRIIVHDTLTATRRLLQAPLADRPALLREMLEPVAAMYAYAPTGDPVEAHQFGNGFRVDRDDDRYLPALERLAKADAWGQVERCLAQG